LVCGPRNKEIQKKLLTEEQNFDKALKKALGAKAAEKDVAAFSREDATLVNKLDSDGRPPYLPRRTCRPPGKGRGKKPLNQNQNNSTSECLSCGKTGHPHSQCKYRNYSCHTCGRSGHITDACKSKSQKIHSVEEPEVSQLNPPSDPFPLSVFSINAENSGIEVPVELNGIHLLMELDTGAEVLIISQETYNKHFKETLVQLKYQNQNVTVPLLVVQGSGPSLFGRNWIGRKYVPSVAQTQASHPMSRHNCTTLSSVTLMSSSLALVLLRESQLNWRSSRMPSQSSSRPVQYLMLSRKL